MSMTERSTGQVERVDPVPEPEVARDEGAMTGPVAMPARPVVEMPPEDEPEVRVLGQSEDPERVAPNITPGATGLSYHSDETLPSWIVFPLAAVIGTGEAIICRSLKW